jgi:methylated-DNA-[protein]-cysteine S-methyltransferase
MLLHYDEFSSPIGRILYASDGDAVCALDFSGYESRMETLLARRYSNVEFRHDSDPLGLNRLLENYFGGDLHAFDAIPVRAHGSPFQELVWKALRTIPAGETWSYGQLAMRLNRPKAARAVGHANSLNPVAIIVPCHRVIGSSTALTGYAGGLERKRWLLHHEGALCGDLQRGGPTLALSVPVPGARG